MIVQNSYKLTRTRRHVVGMSCGSRNSLNSYKYRINSYRTRVYLYFVMNIVDMSYGTRRTVLTKTLVTQLVDICGDMWGVIIRANSSHIVGKLVTVGQGLKISLHYLLNGKYYCHHSLISKPHCHPHLWGIKKKNGLFFFHSVFRLSLIRSPTISLVMIMRHSFSTYRLDLMAQGTAVLSQRRRIL